MRKGRRQPLSEGWPVTAKEMERLKNLPPAKPASAKPYIFFFVVISLIFYWFMTSVQLSLFN